MIPGFALAVPSHIRFGAGVAEEAAAVVRELGSHPLLVHGSTVERVPGPLLSLAVARLGVREEPTFEMIRLGVHTGRAQGVDCVVGVGGGSVIDAAKAIAMLLGNGGDPMDYAEVIGEGLPILAPSLPMVAIPTTAGAGSEVTRNAVLLSKEHGVKVSLRADSMLPSHALVDPKLTLGLPQAMTASTGMDALSQVIEPYVSCRANPYTDGLCGQAIRRIGRSLGKAWEEPGNLSARSDMALAALFGGLALTNAGLGAVHGFAAPIGGRFPAPHGAVCAVLLAPVMRANLRALEKAGRTDVLVRYDEIGQWLTGNEEAGAADGLAWIEARTRRMNLPGLSAYGVGPEHAVELAGLARRASSMKGNPVELGEKELVGIVEQALG